MSDMFVEFEMKQRIKAHDLFFDLFIEEKKIKARVAEIGCEMARNFKGQTPVFLGVLNGASIFMADLVRACDLDCEMAFVRLSSYEGTQSSGQLKKVLGLDLELKTRHVIIVEDIIDTGLTMSRFIPEIESRQPASVSLATLLLKPDALQCALKMDYVGFEIPNKFVIGYGLDYNGLGRNLPAIYQLSE